MLDKV
ncbi:unnamed protein product, partial [Didymodactylos carnosus]